MKSRVLLHSNMHKGDLMDDNVLKNDDSFDKTKLEFKPEVIEAMEEAKRISRDPNVKKYDNLSELFSELDL